MPDELRRCTVEDWLTPSDEPSPTALRLRTGDDPGDNERRARESLTIRAWWRWRQASRRWATGYGIGHVEWKALVDLTPS